MTNEKDKVEVVKDGEEPINIDELNNGENKENESRAFILIEMQDEMDKAIENLTNILERQRVLIDVIKNSDKAEYFKEFMTDVEKDNKNFEFKIERLKAKRAALADVNTYKDKWIVERLLVALG